MADLPVISQDDLATLATFFGNGYAYRHALLTKRGARNEAELHTLVMAVVASVFLWVLYSVIRVQFPPWVSAEYKLPIALASHLLTSYLLGLCVAHMGGKPKITRLPILGALIGESETQSVIRFLQDSDGKYLRFKMDDGGWYIGHVAYFDKDPERFKDLHIVFVNLWQRKGEVWCEMKYLTSMVVCAENIKLLQTDAMPQKPVKSVK